MAKHTQNRLLTDTIREIQHTRSRFISLMVLSALAVCFLAGLRVTAPDMKHSADLYLDQQKLMDLRIVGTLGLTEEDAQALEQQPGITAVERAYTIDAILHLPQNDYVVKAHSYTDTPGLNAPKPVEGRLPERSDECLVEPLFLQETGLSIGDAIRLDTGDGNFQDALSSPEFTIVGSAHSPLYVGVERGSSSLGSGKVSAFLMLPLGAFEMETYTDFYLQVDGMEELLCYSDAYTDGIDAFKDQLKPFALRRADLRGQSVLSEANGKLADAEAELAEAEAEAAREIAEGQAELDDARRELNDGWAEYRDGLDTLNRETANAETEITDGERELSDALTELNDGEQKLADARKELDDGWAEYHDGQAQLAQGRQQLQAQQGAYTVGLDALRANLTQLNPSLHYTDNASLLSAMADPTQSSVIDGTLDGARSSLQGGVDLLDGIAALRTQLGNYADADLSALQREKDGLDRQIAALQTSLTALQNQMDAMDPHASGYAALALQLQESNDQLTQAQTAAEQLEAAVTGITTLRALEQQRDANGLTHADPETLRADLNGLYTTFNGQTVPITSAVLLGGKEQLDEGLAELDAADLDLENALQKLNDGEQELLDGRKTLDDGWKEYNDGLAELTDARETLKTETADAQRELDEGLADLEQGEADYADGLREFTEGKAEAEEKIADAHKELEQARRDIAEIDESEWYLLGRNTNMGYVSYSMDADRMGNLASVFPLIFFLVAALVCLTTMTRMVEEQRITIGGLKALGYSKGQIAIKYVGYGFLASAIGALLGLAVGLTLIPWIICNAWNIIYQLGPIHYCLDPVTSTLACLAAIGTVTLSALGACFSTLAAVPAQLMRPKAPPVGKRVLLEKLPFIWSRLSFHYKITIRNLFRYKKRFWMTVIGIGGCAALIVTAFGLRGSIFDVMDKQFDEIYTHTTHISLVNKITPGELREVSQELNENPLVNGWLTCRSESVTTETAAYTVDATLQVFDSQQAVAPFIDLRHRTNADPVLLPDDGVVLTEKLAKLLGVQPGDTFVLDGESRAEVRVADITEHYIQHYVYMTDDYYQTLMGQPCENNLILADYPMDDPGVEELEKALVSLDGVSSLSRISDTRKTFTSSLASVDYAVVLIIVCAAALAFVVLYNLTNINITERMRELATLKVLGFYDGELSAYVYRENVILTVFGVGMGMLMGKLLHQWLILTVEIDLLMFGRVLDLSSYLYSVVLTVLFSLLVNLSAHKKLKKLDMIESLKTVE